MAGVYAGSNRMRVAIIVLGVLLCSAATAEPQPWMKKENPETLRSVVVVNSECKVSTEDVQKVVDGVLIRSRLKPGDYLNSPDDFGFIVMLDCSQGAQFIIDADVRFVRYIPYLGRNLFETHVYGTYGVGRPEGILETVKGHVEELVTDYLQANFELAPE